MAIKRKAVTTGAKRILGGPAAKDIEKQVEDQDVEMEQEEEEEVEEPEELTEEELLAKRDKEEKAMEKETLAAREKELKSMYVDDLKKLAESNSLQIGKRDDMIKAIVKSEAKERAQKREYEASMRAVVTKKKGELDGLSAPELKRLCTEKGIKGNLSKVERVEVLLKLWVEDDGIKRTQLQQARDERESELFAMDKEALKAICEKAGVEVFLRDVMVDRLVKFESEKGKFSKPQLTLEQDLTDATPKVVSKASLVDALLAKQKTDKEMSDKQKEEATKLAQKVKDLCKKSVEELKKVLTKRRIEIPGSKKEQLVKAFIDADAAEEAAAAIKAKLMSAGSEDLVKLIASRGLGTSKSKNAMVEALLAHEADLKKQLVTYEAKKSEAAAKKKDSLKDKTANVLKDMCTKKGLAAGVGKDERIDRLVEDALQDGELDVEATKLLRSERTQALESMDKAALVKLCEDFSIDVLVKEVMVERVLSHEAEIGEPVTKKVRKSNK
jgi:hypothetical protein